ncbi:RNA polymerase II [Salpingoeca rosetta]|uniref:DNA-directed RNA polymerase subunit beta n=1 Tax=Salpingoeca rosetta (strain ATCC 50818 / BSB-021) TaxID=946362 RepID=F2UFB8_SALR5|nr:RNA polymerase II [Salpingoeca rosetta]EGD75318.1 RNA polymerase II [Salpingoeca rosetta]|eukprot:XP_004992371.1 RNA polymerase II [Salpingoeca rosetta]
MKGGSERDVVNESTDELLHHMHKDADNVAHPINNIEDKWRLLPSFLQLKGLVRQHVDSFNHFVEIDIHNIVKANSKIVSDVNPRVYLEYTSIRVGEPVIQNGPFDDHDVTPMECRLRNTTYAAPMHVNVRLSLSGEVRNYNDILIGRLPIMLRSKKCRLFKANDEQMAKMGECPLDPGGYFIIGGTEKVILMQEQLSKNRIIVERDRHGEMSASVTSSSAERKTKTIINMKRGNFMLKVNMLAEDVPLVVVLKAMGMTSDQEILQFIGADEQSMELFGPSLQQCAELEVFTQDQALRYLGTKVRIPRREYGPSRRTKEDEARSILASVVLSHIEVRNFDMRPKCIYLCVMARRMIAAIRNKSGGDDRDYYGNKRLELAGSLMALLFEDSFKTLNGRIKRELDHTFVRVTARAFDPAQIIRANPITQAINYAISSGNWNLKRFRMERAGVTSVLSRLSFIAALGMMTRITSQFEKTRKVSGPRSLQPSQWGMLCPSDTPEGETCGLVKNLALMSYVTVDVDEAPLIRLAYNLGVEGLNLVNGEEFSHEDTYVVFVNGTMLGVTRSPHHLVRAVRLLRRAGRINEFVSAYISASTRTVHIASDAGRVCRPYIIVEHGQPLVTPQQLRDLALGILHFDDFIRLGVVEYLDVNELNDSLIALYEKDMCEETTHLEIEPFTVLGACAGLIPYPHHNQSPRNTYQCAMGKQAMGVIAYNYQRRIDTLLYALMYPQRPLVKTKTIELIDFEKLPAGQVSCEARVCASGPRWYRRSRRIPQGQSKPPSHTTTTSGVRFCTYATRVPGVCVRFATMRHRFTVAAAIHHVHLHPVSALSHQDVLVNKEVPAGTVMEGNKRRTVYTPAPVKFKGAEGCDAYCDQVAVTSSSENYMIIKIRVRSTRIPELGDKFSSRHGQKGVCGLIVNQEDMPFNDQGVCPDMIMNPHGFPSRMTVGKLMELVGGKAAVLSGNFNYGTAFGGTPLEEMCETLVDHGYNYHGKEFLTSGITGEPLEAYIFFGPVYYQKLKHMVMDKMHARATGPITLLTRQPTEGRSRQGGLRLGEMERDCLIGHGTSMLLLERLMVSSDAFEVTACSKCGLLGYAGWCQYCKSSANVCKLELPYACKLLFQELQSMNIVPRLTLQHYSEQ